LSVKYKEGLPPQADTLKEAPMTLPGRLERFSEESTGSEWNVDENDLI